MGEDLVSTQPLGGPPQARYASAAKEWVRSKVVPSLRYRASALGRYQLRGVLGSGGMGTVFDAYDPKLERYVAIKVIRRSHASAAKTLKARMLREARSLAAISHPNLVSVFEVGISDSEPFIVMEKVDGTSLDVWIRGEHPWRQVTEVFCAAGRGLAACHRVGVVHRDFKPSNVMLGRDGVVRVLDLGLVRPLEAGRDRGRPRDPSDDVPDLQGRSMLTPADQMLGTPAYVAPECCEGGPATEASDQFSFCVALYEGLYGERPYGGTTRSTRLAAVRAGQLERPPRLRRVPRRIRRIVVRGLEHDPSRRFPSMEALLTALEHATRRRRRLGWGVAAAAAIGALWAMPKRTENTGCRDAVDARHTLWQETQRLTVRDSLSGIDTAYAEFTAEKVDGLLEAYEQELHQNEVAACEPDRSPPAEGRMEDACLRRRRVAFDRTVEVLAAVDANEGSNAVMVASSLPTADDCALHPGHAGEGRRVDPIDAEFLASLERARVLHRIGRYGETVELAKRIASRAEELGAPAVFADATLIVGHAHWRSHRTKESRAAYEAAFYVALDAGLFEAAADAAGGLTALAADELFIEEAEHWLRHAEALYERARGKSPYTRANVEALRANVAIHKGAYADAARHMRLAVDHQTRIGGSHDVQLTWMLSNLAGMLVAAGDLDEAAKSARQSIIANRRFVGSQHPLLADAFDALALIETDRYHLTAADEAANKALAIRTANFGGDHPAAAPSLLHLALVRMRLGQYDAALVFIERVERVYEAAGDSPPLLAIALANRAWAEHQLGRPEAAVETATRAIALLEATAPPQYPPLAPMLEILASAHIARGDFEAAARAASRSMEVLRLAFGEEDWRFLAGHRVLAVLQHARGELGSAVSTCAGVISKLDLSTPRPGFVELLTDCARFQISAGDARGAASVARRAVEQATGQDPNFELWHAQLVLAQALAAEDQDAQIDGYSRALTTARAIGLETNEVNVARCALLSALAIKPARAFAQAADLASACER